MKRYRPPEESQQDQQGYSHYDTPSQPYNSRSPPRTERTFHFEPTAYSQPQAPQHQKQPVSQQQQYVNFHPVTPVSDLPPEKKQKTNNYFEWKQENGPMKVNPSSESKRVKERERRKIISDSITQLRNAIPVNFNGDKLNQVNTMTLAIKYIKFLQKRVAELEGSTDLNQAHLLSNYTFNPEEEMHYLNTSDHPNRNSSNNNDNHNVLGKEAHDMTAPANNFEIKVDPSHDSNSEQPNCSNPLDNDPNYNNNKQRNNKSSFAPAAATLTELTDASANLPPFVNDSSNNAFYQQQPMKKQTGPSTMPKFLQQDSTSQDDTTNYNHPAQELVSETTDDHVTKRRAPRRLPIIGETDVLKKPDVGETTLQDSYNLERTSKDTLTQHS